MCVFRFLFQTRQSSDVAQEEKSEERDAAGRQSSCNRATTKSPDHHRLSSASHHGQLDDAASSLQSLCTAVAVTCTVASPSTSTLSPNVVASSPYPSSSRMSVERIPCSNVRLSLPASPKRPSNNKTNAITKSQMKGIIYNFFFCFYLFI